MTDPQTYQIAMVAVTTETVTAQVDQIAMVSVEIEYDLDVIKYTPHPIHAIWADPFYVA